MDLIELADELTIGQLAEIFARKLLSQEQSICKAICDDESTSEQDKREYRNVLANVEALALQARESNFEQLFHHNMLLDCIDVAIGDCAGEYVRVI